MPPEPRFSDSTIKDALALAHDVRPPQADRLNSATRYLSPAAKTEIALPDLPCGYDPDDPPKRLLARSPMQKTHALIPDLSDKPPPPSTTGD